ncbi:MAG: 16S rRNA (uracil(1498)-N(3))-methyltransferase [Alphaproteobacteria bacterium]
MGRAAPARVRLYVEEALETGRTVSLTREQAHYATNVMRLGLGDELALFNGRDGEWRTRIVEARRGRTCMLKVDAQSRPQEPAPNLWLVFAPVKHARLDFIAGKATELGVSLLWPVITRHTVVTRVNLERLRANAIEAAEQCERLTVPRCLAAAALEAVLANWPLDRHLLLCDETGAGAPIAEALSAPPPGPWAVMVGPEGGFAPTELEALRAIPRLTPVALGPRVLTAETAALSALACWQALVGDWRRARPRAGG